MKSQVWKRRFFPVLLTYFIDSFGLAVVYPIFTPLFLRPHFDLLQTGSFMHRTILLGLLIASFPLAQFFGAPMLGMISDKTGRKQVFFVTIIGGIIGYLITGLGVHLRMLTLLWTGRAITGFFAGNLTLCLAAIADISKNKEDRTRNFGWIGIMGGLGFVLAILVGGSFSNPDVFSFSRPDLPFFLTAFLSFCNLILLGLFFKESHTTPEKHHTTLRQGLVNTFRAIHTKEVSAFYIVYFLFMLCWVPSMQFLSTYLIHVFHAKASSITLTFVSIGITWTLANFIVNKLLAHVLATTKTFFISLTLLSVFLYLTLIPHEPFFIFLIHFLIATLCAALTWTNGLATISLKSPQLLQGSLLGVNQSLVAIASILGPILGGIIAGLSITMLYCLTASFALIGVLTLFVHSLRGKT